MLRLMSISADDLLDVFRPEDDRRKREAMRLELRRKYSVYVALRQSGVSAIDAFDHVRRWLASSMSCVISHPSVLCECDVCGWHEHECDECGATWSHSQSDAYCGPIKYDELFDQMHACVRCGARQTIKRYRA